MYFALMFEQNNLKFVQNPTNLVKVILNFDDF